MALMSAVDFLKAWREMSSPVVWLHNDNQLSIFPTDQYGNLQPETATEMEVPCPRCGHRAAPEHITKLSGKHGYGCKCWSCQFTWEHNG